MKLSSAQYRLWIGLSQPSHYVVRNEKHSMLCPLLNCFGIKAEIVTYYHRSTVDALIKKGLLKLTDKPNRYKINTLPIKKYDANGILTEVINEVDPLSL